MHICYGEYNRQIIGFTYDPCSSCFVNKLFSMFPFDEIFSWKHFKNEKQRQSNNDRCSNVLHFTFLSQPITKESLQTRCFILGL